jgi:OmpA-OmpF porin, OOP family
MKKAWIMIVGLAAAAVALPASAQQRFDSSAAYLGLSVGQAKFSDACEGASALGVTCDNKDTAFRIFGGYQFHPNIAVELGYADLGKATASGPGGTASAEASAFDLVGVLSWPVGNAFSVYGKLGLYHGEVEGGGALGGSSDSGTDLTYGLGAQFNVGRNVGLRAEWQRYNDVSGSDIDVLSIGVLYRFR